MLGRQFKQALTLGLLLAIAASAGAARDTLASNLQKTKTFHETKLVSDLASEMAVVTDPCLHNPWGITYTNGGSPFWISDNNAGVSTLYNVPNPPLSQSPPVSKSERVVATSPTSSPPVCPPATDASIGAPTGVVFNIDPTSTDFVLTLGGKSGPALFIFDTEAGTIAGWNMSGDPASAVIVKDNSPGAVYKGLAMAGSGGSFYLYATNFRAGTVDVFDNSFTKVTLTGSFSDPNIPSGFAPFGIQGFPVDAPTQLYVTYAAGSRQTR